MVIYLSEIFREAEVLQQRTGAWYPSGYNSAATQAAAKIDGLCRRALTRAVATHTPVGVCALDTASHGSDLWRENGAAETL